MKITNGHDIEITGIEAGGLIVINGETYHGRNITVKGDKVVVDGVERNVKSKSIVITVHGDVGAVTTVGGDVTCSKAESIKTTAGDVRVGGDVYGDVRTVSGNVSGKKINGGVSTVSGNVNKRLF